MPIYALAIIVLGLAGGAVLIFLALRTDIAPPPALVGGGRTLARTSPSARSYSSSVSVEYDDGDVSSMLNAASGLMLSGMYEDCIDLYATIATEYPEEAGLSYWQIGAAYHLMGDYEEAISYYHLAKTHGADPDIMDSQIDEALTVLQSQDISDDNDDYYGEDYGDDDDYGDDEDEDDDDAWGGEEE